MKKKGGDTNGNAVLMKFYNHQIMKKGLVHLKKMFL